MWPLFVASDNQEEVSKPLPGGSFEACVRRFEDDGEVDDPEALCGWLETQADKGNEVVTSWDPEEDTLEDLVDALSDPEAEKVLQELTVTYVSGVENPAQDSHWLMAKDADAHGADWGVSAPLLLRKGTFSLDTHGEGDEDDEEDNPEEGEEEQKAWAPVLIPNETDKQGDVIPPHEIEQAAHNFLANFRKIDTDHDLMDGKGVPIESWTLKESTTFSLPNGEESREYPAGTWMLGVQFNDEAWSRVKSGELQGFSIYGEAENTPVEEILGIGSETVERTAGSPISLEDAQEVHSIAKSVNNTLHMSESDNEDGEGAEAGEANEALESIKSTVEENNTLAKEAREDLNDLQKSHESLEDRVDSLESDLEAVKSTEDGGTEDGEGEEAEEANKDEDGDGESVTEEDLEEAKEALKDEVAGEVEDAAENAAEKAVKSVLGLGEDEDLPEDEDERRDVIRKGLVEPEDEGGESLGSPDSWEDEDVAGVYGGAN